MTDTAQIRSLALAGLPVLPVVVAAMANEIDELRRQLAVAQQQNTRVRVLYAKIKQQHSQEYNRAEANAVRANRVLRDGEHLLRENEMLKHQRDEMSRQIALKKIGVLR